MAAGVKDAGSEGNSRGCVKDKKLAKSRVVKMRLLQEEEEETKRPAGQDGRLN